MLKTYHYRACLFIPLVLGVILCSCGPGNSIEGDFRMNIRNRQQGRISRVYKTFTGFETESLEARGDQIISFSYEAIINRGSLMVTWHDPHGRILWRGFLTKGDRGNEEIAIDIPGEYSIVIQGINTNGSFKVGWHIE
jgi:hypothetical protein